ncbi:MAG: hypothetical protein ACYCOS_07890 [Sulfobacillus sp.]
MPRSQAADLVQAASITKLALLVMISLVRPAGRPPDVSWIEALNAENWHELSQDLDNVLKLPEEEDAGVALQAVFHEWSESMAVLTNPKMVHRMAQARRLADDSKRSRIRVPKGDPAD